MKWYILILAFLSSLVNPIACGKSGIFRAAALEHKVIMAPDRRNATTREEALRYMQHNLDIYRKNAQEAGRQVGLVLTPFQRKND